MQKKTVLLVEDSSDDIELTKRAFKKSRYSDEIKLDVVTDGVEAIDYFDDKQNENNNKPYLILLDLNLPRIDGFQVLKKIKNDENLKHIPLIVLTCSGEEKDLVKSYELGANGYIQKPIDFKRFIEVVRKIGDYWVGINKHPYAAS